jgi:hypothetical protein
MIRSEVRKTATPTVTVTSWDETRDGAPNGQPPIAHRGRHEVGVARTKGRVVAGSATGELAGLSGDVEAAADDTTYQVTISHVFDNPALH